MKGGDLVLRMLDIEKPWGMTNLKIDVGNRRLHVWVANMDIKVDKKSTEDNDSQACDSCAIKSVFKWNDQDVSWFHVGLGVYSTKVHAKVRVYDQPCGEPYCGVNKLYFGQTDLGVTDILAYQVVELLGKGVEYSIVCDLFKIPLQAVWAVKHKFDSGSLAFASSDQPHGPKPRDNANIVKRDSSGSSLPNVDSGAWAKLLSKDNSFKTRSLSLKFMLTKTRSQIKNMHDKESRRIKIGELRHFFEKHHRMLYKEIAQLDRWAKNA